VREEGDRWLPGVHVGRGRDDLRGAHLLHALQGLLPLGGIQVGVGALAGHLGPVGTQHTRGPNTQNQGREHNKGKGRVRGFESSILNCSLAVILYGLDSHDTYPVLVKPFLSKAGQVRLKD
jgi:hypothetical protein